MLHARTAHRASVIGTVIAISLSCAAGKDREVALAAQHNISLSGGSTGFVAQESAPVDRKLVRTGALVISVDSPEETLPKVQRIIEDAHGFVERSEENGNSDVWLHCRVPAAQLDSIMDAVSELGDEERRSVSATDVTEQHTDLKIRLDNNLALRDRLKQLVQRASDVEDVLAIEKELSRIQAEIETMQAQLDRLESEVELSALSINLQRKRILGPLGYVGYGVWWLFSKLFVVR